VSFAGGRWRLSRTGARYAATVHNFGPLVPEFSHGSHIDNNVTICMQMFLAEPVPSARKGYGLFFKRRTYLNLSHFLFPSFRYYSIFFCPLPIFALMILCLYIFYQLIIYLIDWYSYNSWRQLLSNWAICGLSRRTQLMLPGLTIKASIFWQADNIFAPTP
jgi:hypothetical protein